MNKIYQTAIYLRLSKDEGDQESGSIANQRQMLMAFLSEREDLEFAAEYADDGYGGYDFNRPQFQRMIEAARNGEIDCIVVKDLSRFGRNFQKTEEYIERILPKFGVRFIAINNCFDTSREQSPGERLTRPMLNLMNEWHVMETSQKVRSVLEHHRQNGKFIGNHAVYGYLIEDKHLVVDPEAAEIVRKIFDLKIEGWSNQSISEYLNEIGVASPLEHKLTTGVTATGVHLRSGERATWSSGSVRRILENPVYIGTLVQGKTTSVSYRDKRRYRRDSAELISFEDAHEPIVSDTTFLIVQDLLSKDNYSKGNKKSYLFSGFAFCGCCGNPLYHRQYKEMAVWRCTHKGCSVGTIPESIIANAVFQTLKVHIDIVLNQTELDKPDDLADTSLMEKQIEEIKQQTDRLHHSISCLEQQKTNGIISEEDYQEMCRFYHAQLSRAAAEMKAIQHRKDRLLRCCDEARERYRQFFEMTELTRAVVGSLVEKIEVFGKSRLRIYLRYQDIFKEDGDTNGT